MIRQHPSLISGFPHAILTPNQMEYASLCNDLEMDANSSPQEVSEKLGSVTIIKKGSEDIIACGGVMFSCNEPSALRRFGGQGDMLAGALGCMVAWTRYVNRLEVSFFLIPFVY